MNLGYILIPAIGLCTVTPIYPIIIFNIEYKWSQIEFDYQSEEERQEAIQNGTFNEGFVQPIDVQYYYDFDKQSKRVFITNPREAEGIPATLGIITDKKRNDNPIIKPYPSWDWHTELEKCKKRRIVSVYRVVVDECDRLWVLDNGKINSNQVCPPQILAFNLKTDELIRQYEFPFEQHQNLSLLTTPVVEVEDPNSGCRNTFVYNANSVSTSLIVYDFKNDKSWKITDKTFYPYPNYGTFNIAGKTFELMDGILGLALSPPGNNRKLFYHAMSSDTENWVYTKYLKNESLFTTPLGAPQLFHTYPRGRHTQSAAEAMDKYGNLYFGLLEDIQIAKWNIKKPYNDNHIQIIGNNKETMQFPSGVKVTPNQTKNEILWIFATDYQKISSNSLFSNQTNFRILCSKI